MGYGDELMAAGKARSVYDHHGGMKRVVILDKTGSPRKHDLWNYCSYIEQSPSGDKSNYCYVINSAGARPYVDYDAMKRDFLKIFPDREFTTKVKDPRLPWRFNMQHRALPADLDRMSKSEYHGAIVVEPHVKSNAPNKQWGWDRWQELVSSHRDLPWVQMGPVGTKVLNDVEFYETKSFENALFFLSGAASAVLPEGGLHHGSAALSLRVVVIYGGFTSPIITGYRDHINIAWNSQHPCGQRVPGCEHCKRAMGAITPREVFDCLETLLDENQRRRGYPS